MSEKYRETYDGDGMFPYPHPKMLKAELSDNITEGLDDEEVTVTLGLLRRMAWHTNHLISTDARIAELEAQRDELVALVEEVLEDPTGFEDHCEIWFTPNGWEDRRERLLEQIEERENE